LQGIMGGYYARGREPDDVADSIRDHYKPQGPGDSVPTAPVTIAVALADKIDMLTGFFGVDERPTGSKDPFALRRAALGMIRLINDAQVRVSANYLFRTSAFIHSEQPLGSMIKDSETLSNELVTFLIDRLKVSLRDQDVSSDLVDAVISGSPDDIFHISDAARKLAIVLREDYGKRLLYGYKRAVGFLNSEEKKGPLPAGSVAVRSDIPQAEWELTGNLFKAMRGIEEANKNNSFLEALTILSELSYPIAEFSESVFVNDPDPEIRENRLKLLIFIRDVFHGVADFSKISG